MSAPEIVVAMALAAGLGLIAAVDLRTRRVPDALSLPLVAAGFVSAFFLSSLPLADHVLGACAGYLALAVLGEIYFRTRGREGLGLGDAKLFAAAGAWTGWIALPFVLFAAAVSGLVFALATKRRSGSAIAFAPHLAAGFFVVWLFGAPQLPPVWR